MSIIPIWLGRVFTQNKCSHKIGKVSFFSLAYVTFIGLSTVSLNMLNVLPLSLFVNRVGGTLEGSERPTDRVGQLHQRQK